MSPVFVSAARETPQEISPARGRVYRPLPAQRPARRVPARSFALRLHPYLRWHQRFN